MNGSLVKYSKKEKVIAELYIFLLPIRMISPLLGVASLLHGAALYFDFILNILGLMIYLMHSDGKIYLKNDKATNLTKIFVISISLLNILSLIMAIVTQVTQGNYAGESAFSGILGMEIYYFQYILMVVYNRRIFNILTEEKIWKILSWCSSFLLLLGYYQMAVLLFGGFFRSILSVIDIFGIFWPDANMWKLSLTGKEGAEAGTIFGVFVLPYLISCIILEKNKMKYILQCILWLPVLIMMQSTSAYLMVAAVIIGSIFYVSSVNSRKGLKILLVMMFFLVVGFFFGDLIVNSIPSNIRYLIFNKATDLNNGSTVSRTVPFITNWKIFLQHPIIGAGNGLQGYYYIENVPQWALHVAGSDMKIFYHTAKTQIINGGVFFPAFLSGYGLIGIAILFNLFCLMKKCITGMKHNNKFRTLFCIAIWGIVVCGFQGDFSGNYLIWFIISIPFISCLQTDNVHSISSKRRG